MRILNGGSGGNLGAPIGSPLEGDYARWILELQDFSEAGLLTYNKIISHKFNGKGYNDFLANFKNNFPDYNYPIHPSLDPLVLQSITGHLNC